MPKSESSASKIFRDSGMTVAFKTTFDVFTRVGPDNSLERLTERSVGLVTMWAQTLEALGLLLICLASHFTSISRSQAELDGMEILFRDSAAIGDSWMDCRRVPVLSSENEKQLPCPGTLSMRICVS